MLLRDLTHDVLPPRAVLLSDDVVLMVVPDGGGGAMAGHPGLVPPYGTVAVQGPSGPHHIAAMRLPAGANGPPLPGARARGGFPVAMGADAVDLAEELDRHPGPVRAGAAGQAGGELPPPRFLLHPVRVHERDRTSHHDPKRHDPQP